MKKVYVFAFLFICASTISVFGAAQSANIVNPKDQTDVYGIPTDMDEVEESQEMQSTRGK